METKKQFYMNDNIGTACQYVSSTPKAVFKSTFINLRVYIYTSSDCHNKIP